MIDETTELSLGDTPRRLLEVENLRKYFKRTKGFTKRVVGTVKAVDGASFHVDRGETLALVGESGSGKTTLGRSVLRAIEPTGGTVRYNLEGKGSVDFLSLSRNDLKDARRDLSMVFQDPYSSLNPRLSVLEIVGEPLRNYNQIANQAELEERVSELLRQVRLDPDYMSRYPHAFSGGQRQRIAIARALSLQPKFVVADEPVSALDVSVQAQILNLMKELQAEFGLTYLIVAHNLAVVEYIADRVAVMYVGQIVEQASTQELFGNPLHPYTEALLSAVPKGDPDLKSDRIILEGDVADPANAPSGCYFHPRCRYCKDICREKAPELKSVGGADDTHVAACHFVDTLSLTGVESH